MRILYDGQIYAEQPAGGVNRYFANIISRLPADVTPALTTCETRNVNYPSHPNLKTFFYQRWGFRPTRFCYWLEKHYFRAVSTFNQFDLIHPTYYSSLTRQELSRQKLPIVLTVWDMIHEVFYPGHPHIELKRKAVSEAQAIICISENTKKDLLHYYSIPEEKISVTYLASEIDANFADSDQPVSNQPYFLYVGSRRSYKNFDGLLAAFAKVVSVHPEIMLCVVGYPFEATELAQITDMKLTENIQHYQFPDDAHLAKLYRGSVAFIYPSKYEGFGIPPLEAMSCGTAVIAANSSSIPEVVGDGGLLFNPHSIPDLVDRMLFLIEHPTERDRLIEKGTERAKKFSWKKTASQTLEIYRSVV